MNRDSTHNRPSDSESIEATAAAWLAELDDGPSPAREREFADWRAADPRYEAAVSRLENTWSVLQQLRDFRPAAERHPDCDLLRAQPIVRRRRSMFPALATAGIAASLALAAFWWSGHSHETSVKEQRYATTVDGYERVTLQDRSQLELNAASEVSVEFTPAERRVRLLRGEAHFTVTKDKARPFLVEAGTVAVRAIGTAFNVRLGAANVEVLVVEGQVQLDEAARPVLVGGALPVKPGPPSNGSPTFLAVNERIVIPTVRLASATAAVAAPVVEKIAPDVVREALAWQGPRLVFLDTPLAHAVEQFNRRNQVQLELADAELAGLPIGGSFRAENVDAFVRLLQSGGDIAVDRRDATHIVLRKMK